MAKIVVLPLLILFACLLAAFYGAVHNQISYTLGPDYFQVLKFPQFNIAPAMPDRVGAALVGVWASWWMGVVIGLPIAVVALRARSVGRMVGVFARASVVVVALTMGLGALSLLIPLSPALVGAMPMPPGVTDASGFARAALMHEVSYGAGLLGLLAGLTLSWRQTRA